MNSRYLLSRRGLLAGGVGALALPALARAQQFPSRPIKLILPYSAGGTDVQYRKLADLVSRQFGQPVVVENKPGGAGTAAIVSMARTARPDGYTIGASTVALLRQPHMQQVDYDPFKELTWICGLGSFTFVVLVKNDSPFRTLADLVAWAKANPGKLSYATPGASSSQFMAMAQLGRAAGIDTLHIPFRGGGEINTAVLGGHVMVGVNTLAGLAGLEGNELRGLVCFDPERPRGFASLPTAKELGYDVVYTTPYGIVGPAGMEPAIVTRLQNAFRDAVGHPENQQVLDTIHQHAWYRSADDYLTWARENFESERQLVTSLNIRLD